MSKETWLKEFYPTPAAEFADIYPGERTIHEELAAAKHSLQKWKGLRSVNQFKHGLADKGIPIDIDADSCSLCVLSNNGQCEQCPLAEVRDDQVCSETEFTDGTEVDAYESVDRVQLGQNQSPFQTWKYDADPEPMIYWLEKTVTMLEGRL